MSYDNILITNVNTAMILVFLKLRNVCHIHGISHLKLCVLKGFQNVSVIVSLP